MSPRSRLLEKAYRSRILIDKQESAKSETRIMSAKLSKRANNSTVNASRVSEGLSGAVTREQ